jgi:hypothetical protein
MRVLAFFLGKAWAAELIRSDHIGSLTPQLVSALGGPPPAGAETETDEDRARLAILDALIEIGSEVHTLIVVSLVRGICGSLIWSNGVGKLGLRTRCRMVRDSALFPSLLPFEPV